MEGRHRQDRPLRRFALTAALVGERIGVRELEDGRWLVTFVHRDLGHYDDRERRFIPLSIDLPGVDPGNKEINEKEEENKPDETEAAAQ